ncbi:MAG: DUF4340 domain-containing protein [Bacteroidota bacterium]
MRKTLLYLVILAVLGAGIYFAFFRESTSSSFSDKEAGFNIKDTASIGKLFLVRPDGESVLLQRTDSGWMLNNRYKALRSTLDQLMGTLVKQMPLYPVTEAAKKNAMEVLSTEGVKIEIYDRAGKKMRVFHVGGTAVSGTGTNMLMDGAEKPYVVHVPGFNGYLTPRYTVRLTDWRDRTVFNIPQEEIKSISVQYAGKPINSYRLVREGGELNVIADPSIMNMQPLNKRRAGVYVRAFTNVNCEGYLNGLPDMKATLETAPLQSTIEVTGLHGQHQRADIYWMAINKRSKNLQTTNPDVPDDYDSDRLYAVINGGNDTVMIQQFAFRNVFHKAYEFYQSDSATGNMPAPPSNVIWKKGDKSVRANKTL